MDKEDLRFQFLIEEYKALRKEIDDTMNQMRRIIILNILASGAIWSFIYTSGGNITGDSLFYVRGIPLVICILFGLYWKALGNDVKKIGAYIKKIEKEYSEEGGWENHLHKLPISRFKSTIAWENSCFFVLIVLNLLLALRG